MAREKKNRTTATSSTSRDLFNGLFLNVACNFLLYLGHLIIARRLPRADYATFTVIVSFVSLMALFADLGLTLLFVRKFAAAEALAAAGKRDERGELLGSMLGLRIGMAVIVSIVVIIITPLLGYSLEARHLMMIMLVTLFISSRLLVVRSVGEAFLRGHNKYHYVALFAVLDALVFASVLYFYSSKILDLEGAVWIYSFCHLPGFVLLFGLIYKDARSIGFRLSFRLQTLRTMIREGAPLIFSTAFLTIYNFADALLLDKLSTPLQVSALGAGMRILSAIIFLPIVFAAVIGPLVTQATIKNDITRIRSTIDRTLRLLMICAMFIALVISSAPIFIINFLFGAEKYVDATPLVIIFSWTFIPLVFGTFITEIAIAEGKLWISTLYMGIVMVISVSCDLIFIPTFGAVGVGMAKCIAISSGFVVLLFIIKRIRVLDRTLFFQFIFRIAVVLLITLAARYVLAMISSHEILNAAIISTVFLALIFLSRTIRLREVLAFKREMLK